MIENLRLARLSLGDKGLVENVQDILAHFLELGLDLLAVVTDDGNVLGGSLGFFLLLNGGDDAPGSTTGTDDVLVGDGEEVALVDGKFTIQLLYVNFGSRIFYFVDSSGLARKDGIVRWQLPIEDNG